MDVAAAAVKQADAKEAGQDEVEIPSVAVRPEPSRSSRDRGNVKPAGKGGDKSRKPRREAVTSDGNVVRVYVGAGRKSKVRPADLVGAIVNEAGIDPRVIGAIQITDRFSLVELPDDIADDVIGTLRATTIKGRKVLVRRDRESGA